MLIGIDCQAFGQELATAAATENLCFKEMRDLFDVLSQSITIQRVPGFTGEFLRNEVADRKARLGST